MQSQPVLVLYHLYNPQEITSIEQTLSATARAIVYPAKYPTKAPTVHLMDIDAPVRGHTRLLVMAPTEDEAKIECRLVDMNGSLHQPYEALSWAWGEQDWVRNARTLPCVDQVIEGLREGNGMERWMPWKWNRSERKVQNLRTIQIWKENHNSDEESEKEELLKADMSPWVIAPLSDSKQDSMTTFSCPFCQDVFSGVYRRGNLGWHMRQKHDLRRHVGRSHRRKLILAMLLMGAQLACTVPLNSYDHCHGDSNCRPPIATSTVLNGFPPFFDFLGHPTTNEFVLSALIYSATAMVQYHINDGDRFQQLCLVVGVTTGFFLCVATPVGLDGQQATTSTMAIAITTALLVSALGHRAFAMFSGKDMRKEISKEMSPGEERRIGGNEV